jgi:predicted O-methyltransferase YrrM
MQMEPEEEDAASIVRAEGLCSPEPAAFAALRDETREIWPGGAHMVSGAQQGLLLHTLVRLSRAARVLEVGCFTGYATLWMALGLAEGGTLLSLERDDRCAAVAQRHLDLSGVGDRVELRVGDALHSLEALADHAAVRQGKEPGTEGDAAGPFDVVVWHCGRSQTDCEDAPRKLLDSVLGCVSPNGVLVLSQPPPSQQAGAGDVICGAVASDPALCVVTLPSPDGDGAMLSLISRSVV